MISMASLKAAILMSLRNQARERSEAQKREEAATVQRAERERQREEQQLADMTAMLLRQTKRR